MPTLVLLRHGSTTETSRRKLESREDVPLSGRGRDEAKKAALRLASRTLGGKPLFFRTAHSSPLSRALDTARAVMLNAPECFGTQSVLVEEMALNNRELGELTGWDVDDARMVHGRDLVKSWLEREDRAPREGETLSQVMARVRAYFDQSVLPVLRDGEDVLVVSHSIPLKAMLSCVTGEGFDRTRRKSIPHAAPMIFEFDPAAGVFRRAE